MFDPNQLLDMQTSDANSTRFTPCPEGEWPATISDVLIKSGTSQKTGEAWTRLDVKWEIQGTTANSAVDREKIITNQGIMLNLTDSGGLVMGDGKNVRLGRLREAVGLNAPGQPFSFRMLIGRSGKINVKHRPYEGEVFDEVSGVVKL
jgi:hypothetical protein